MTSHVRLLDRWVAGFADLLMNHRKTFLAVFMLVTLGLGYSALQIRLDPGFNKQIPASHPYMENYLQYSETFTGANTILVGVNWLGEGDIYNPEFLEVLRQVTDEVFFIPGVRRASVRSLFTPDVRYVEISEEGFVGDVVIPPQFSGSPEDLEQVRNNAARSGEIGRLVANDLSAAIVNAELQEFNPATGERVSYEEIARQLEAIRAKYESKNIEVNIVGFSKLVGDVIAGLMEVIGFFVIAFVITALLLWVYSRSLVQTVVALVVALIPVVWLLGILPLIGMGIDPMSILVPFLIFSIGVSHAVQMTNAWKQELFNGLDSMSAAHSACCKIFIPGALALVTNALGFGVIMLIDIPIVRELGISACIGGLLMIFSNKMLLPIVLSYLKLDRRAWAAHHRQNGEKHRLWWRLSVLATPGPAVVVFAISLVLLVGGAWKSRDLIVGDVGVGAPELRQSARYNLDNLRITQSYSIGLDVLAIYMDTDIEEACLDPDVMRAVEELDFHARSIKGVNSTQSVAGMGKVSIAGNNEGNPRWAAIPGSSRGLMAGSRAYSAANGLVIDGCQTMQMLLFLNDHEGDTIAHVVDQVEHIIANIDEPKLRFHLAGGNVGVMAASNEAVQQAEAQMHGSLLLAVALFCWVTFRSGRAVLCILIPLAIVATLCSAVMALFGIGLKVATLPVMALGVGVGVDYGIYLYERMQHELKAGKDLRNAFYEAMCQRGTAALFTAVTMSVGVGTWIFAPLKFQADMGVLLAFMFLVNVFGAIFLLPGLAAWFQRSKPLVKRRAVVTRELVGAGRG
ncbi:efflux RND transporter permease subunit [Halopseudomonas maritima]|uniref:efflux RND transporter permease subunit n=1 Tax=Halopseudomonas maritima TaxID=2918528 RepID=UPI001EEADD45|nr:efflux RND transporter permease subunit [Halopseudomonas maritima]UJJ31542.1 MMPL family transporter [Halopseudomonas maritima]